MPRSIWLLLFLSAGSTLPTAGCGGAEGPTAAPGEWKGLADALRGPSVAEAWRISGGGPPTPGEARGEGGGRPEKSDYLFYRETGGPVTLSQSLQKELTGLLSDPANITDGVHPCIPAPGIKVRYTRVGRDPVWILFCFECTEIFVYEGARQREHKGFDPAEAALGRVMKQVFPDDPVVQRLK